VFGNVNGVRRCPIKLSRNVIDGYSIIPELIGVEQTVVKFVPRIKCFVHNQNVLFAAFGVFPEKSDSRDMYVWPWLKFIGKAGNHDVSSVLVGDLQRIPTGNACVGM
jgi:hypothetical protein